MAMILPHKRPCCVAAFLALLLLAGCVDSAAPLLTGAQPMFGQTVRIHGYGLSEGRANGPEVGNFRWDGAEYRVVGRATFGVAAFTVVPLVGDDLVVQSRQEPIVQTRNAQPHFKGSEYALARKIADGVYSLAAIDEADADEATRAKFCVKSAGSSCRLETAEAALAFARATAAKPDPKRSLAIIVGDRK
jgi:hypothetical protein